MPRFVCDAMLGSLARWLRFFGYDCRFGEVVDDAALAALARREDRWLLTRDRALASVGPRTMLVHSPTLDEQLVEVFRRLELCPAPDLDRARCGACNGELHEISRTEAAGLAPPHVVATAERFRSCRSCGRVYWPGTHSDSILERMVRVVGRVEGPY